MGELCEFSLFDFTIVRRPATDLTQTNTVHDPPISVLHCSQSYYGCCPDGQTPASGLQGMGCPQAPAPAPARAEPPCSQSRYSAKTGAAVAQVVDQVVQ